jgi:hypothetical protein
MVIYNKGGNTWKDWVTNLLHQPDWKDRSIKIADVMKTVLQTETFWNTAQASSGEEKVQFLSRGRVGGLCEVHVVLHVEVELVIPKTVVLPPILGQKSVRRRLAIAQSVLLNIVSVTRVSNPLRKTNKTRSIIVIWVQMLQLRFAISPTVRTRRNSGVCQKA